jgi:hypothetical protein
MWFARYMMSEAARRLISDPAFRDEAVNTYRHVAPKVAAIGRTVSQSVKDSPPAKDPAGFGRMAGRRVGAALRRFRTESRPD